ncbi:hypothetical protein VSQ48_01930 [Candidatus Ventrimonas sp. KK005]
MKTFGELLRIHIEKSGFNIYQFARISGVNRVNIQRYIANQRFPSKDVFKTLKSHLQLPPTEQKELDTAYQISKVGKQLYYRRQSVKKLIESVSLLYENKEQRPGIYLEPPSRNASYSPPCKKEGDIYPVSGFFNIRCLFQTELSRVARISENPFVYLFLPAPPEQTFLIDGLTALFPFQGPPVQITQIFPLSQTNSGTDDQGHNLNIMSSILPLSFSTYFQYEAWFYYDNCMSDKNYGLLYPYYAIFNDCVLIFSLDMKSAFLSTQNALVKLFQSGFLNRLQHCQKLIHTTSNYLDILKYCLSSASDGFHTEYLLNYHPCLVSVGDLDMAKALLREDAENRNTLLDFVTDRFALLQNPDCPPYHYFSIDGLMDFVESGTCSEFPASLVKVIPFSIRKTLINRLREACETDRQILRITDPETFPIPDCLNLNVTEISAFLANYKNDSSWSIISIEETDIRFSFIDFLTFLPESSYVYSKEKTLEILDLASEKLKEKELEGT